MDIQTDLASVRMEHMAAPVVEPQVAAVIEEETELTKTTHEIQLELAKSLDVDLATFQLYLEAQRRGKETPSRPLMPKAVASSAASVEQIGAGARRAGRWAARMSTRAAAQAPALFINVGRAATVGAVHSVANRSLFAPSLPGFPRLRKALRRSDSRIIDELLPLLCHRLPNWLYCELVSRVTASCDS
jgi:hypothetical protein